MTDRPDQITPGDGDGLLDQIRTIKATCLLISESEATRLGAISERCDDILGATRDAAEGAGDLPLAVRLRDEEGPPLPQMVAQRRAQLSAAPPKPAPDAMQNAWSALARLRALTPTEFKAYHSCVDQFEQTLRAIAAPVPPADGAGECCLNWARECSHFQTTGKCCDTCWGKSSPSGAGAAEPGIKCSYCNGTGKVELTIAERNALSDIEMRDVLQKSATPPVRGDREIDIDLLRVSPPRYPSSQARDIAGQAISDMEGERHDGGVYALACWFDAILSLPVQPGAGEREAEWQDIATAPKDQEVEVRGIWKLRGDGIEFTHWRPRQAPHSSREGGR